MALEFPAQAPTLQQKLTTQQGAASVQAGQGLTAGGFGGQRELAAQKGIEAVTKAAGQASAQVQANQTQNLAQSTQQLTNQGQQALQVDAAQQSDALARQRIALSQQSRQLSQVLASSEAASASELFDSNLKFQKDELGRTIFNERQLADYAVNHARSQEELANYEQEVSQILERKQAILQQALRVIQQSQTQAFQQSEQELDQNLQQKVALAKKELEDKMRKQQTDAASTAAIFQGVTMVGAAIAPVFPPLGIAVAVAGAAGSMYTANQNQQHAAGMSSPTL